MTGFFNRPFFRFIFPVLFIPALGAFVGITTQLGVDGWYQALEKPFFNPPDWVFGVAWTILYIMMGAAIGLVWAGQAKGYTAPYASIFRLFVFQLILNLGWSYAFFAGHMIWVCAIWIAVLAMMVVQLVVRLWPHFRLSAILLIPYCCWLAFAFTLNLSIGLLN
jgi:benzodiazapine receptor